MNKIPYAKISQVAAAHFKPLHFDEIVVTDAHLQEKYLLALAEELKKDKRIDHLFKGRSSGNLVEVPKPEPYFYLSLSIKDPYSYTRYDNAYIDIRFVNNILCCEKTKMCLGEAFSAFIDKVIAEFDVLLNENKKQQKLNSLKSKGISGLLAEFAKEDGFEYVLSPNSRGVTIRVKVAEGRSVAISLTHKNIETKVDNLRPLIAEIRAAWKVGITVKVGNWYGE